MSGGDGPAICESSRASWRAGNLPLIAELALFVAKITRSLLNLALSKQKLLRVGLIGLLAAGAANVWGAKPSYRSTTEDVIMSNYDLSPFYRSTVGFDRLFSMLDRVAGGEQNAPTYPPYNIERTGENAYRITLALAGFGENELSVETRENTLTVRGTKETAQQDEKRDLLYQGIAARAFERRFQLADHVVVTGAGSENGLLHIDLVREVPEAQKPRTIAINKGAKTIQSVKAPSAQAA
jgi:molecular chaperone IbpA